MEVLEAKKSTDSHENATILIVYLIKSVVSESNPLTSLFPSSSVALSSSECCLASADSATFRNRSRSAAALDSSVSSTRIYTGIY